jgi:AcrR family transcriptional regulator
VARTQAEDFGDKQQHILDAAAAVFAEKGFNVATTIDIARACQMSKSALYHYHKSKEAILYAMLHSHLTQVLRQVQTAVESETGPQLRFRAFLRSLLESNAASRNKNIVLLNETGALAREQQAEIRRIEKKLVQIGTDLLKSLNAPLMAQSQLRMPYTMFLFGIVNWTYTWYEPGGALSTAEIASRIADLFLRGFPQIASAGTGTAPGKLKRIAGGRG